MSKPQRETKPGKRSGDQKFLENQKNAEKCLIMAESHESMKCVVHHGTNFDKTVRDFQDKRASLMMSQLSAYTVWQLKFMKQGLELQAG